MRTIDGRTVDFLVEPWILALGENGWSVLRENFSEFRVRDKSDATFEYSHRRVYIRII